MRRKYHNRAELVHRLSQPGAPSIAVISEESGVPKATLYAWLSSERRLSRVDSSSKGGLLMTKRSKARSPSTKFALVADSRKLQGDALVAFCNEQGVADGAEANWKFLEPRTDEQILDFFHATEYLTKAAEGKFRKARHREGWMDARCHDLKHKHGSASRITNEMERWMMEGTLSQEGSDKVARSIDYFLNQKPRMKYADFVERNLPIGSGVTEAACKVIIKQRLCASGMTKWKEEGSAAVISLRCLSHSTGRWQQFWDKIDQYGYSLVA